MGSAEQRQIVLQLMSEQLVSASRAIRIIAAARSMLYYRRRRDDSKLIELLQQLARQHPSYGLDKMYYTLRKQGHGWNRKRVYRVYTMLKLKQRRRFKRRLPARIKQPLQVAVAPLHTLSMDFMQDSLVDGRKVRILNAIDDFNRMAVDVEIDTSLSSARVVRMMDRIQQCHGKPCVIRVDNGPEFTSVVFTEYCRQHHIHIQYIQPGKPTQNAYIERYNKSYREAVLDAYLFDNLHQLRELTQTWISHYNEHRPHEALNHLTPREYLLKYGQRPAHNSPDCVDHISTKYRNNNNHNDQKQNDLYFRPV